MSGAAAELRVAAVSLIAAAGALALASLQVSNGIVVMAYSDTVSAFGGVSPYAYAVTTGTLPAGLALDPATGIISGAPTTPGTSAFTITATDAHSVTVNRAFSIVISSIGGGS